MSAWTYRRLTARPPERLFRLVFESHSGRALVPIPKRSTSPRATSTLQWRIGLKALDLERPIREADMRASSCDRRADPGSIAHASATVASPCIQPVTHLNQPRVQRLHRIGWLKEIAHRIHEDHAREELENSKSCYLSDLDFCDWASLASRSAFNRAVFSRVARARTSYSAVGLRPCRADILWLKIFSARCRS